MTVKLEHALYYYDKWGLGIVYLTIKGVPLKGYSFKEFYHSPQPRSWLVETYTGYKKKTRRNIHGIAGLLAPWNNLVVVDIDEKTREVEALVEEYASKTPVTVTKRGYHIWLRLGEPKPEIMVKVGGVEVYSYNHLATLPPSLVRVNDKYFIYKFHPKSTKNKRMSGDPRLLAVVPRETSLEELSDIIHVVAGVRLNLNETPKYMLTHQPQPVVARRRDYRDLRLGHLGFFETVDEVYLFIKEYRGRLPECIKWAFTHHPVGERFIAGSIIVLTFYHLLENPRDHEFSELEPILEELLEDYPEDERGSLDRKLEYVWSRGYYGFPAGLSRQLCSSCKWRSLCGARSPFPYLPLIAKILLSGQDNIPRRWE